MAEGVDDEAGLGGAETESGETLCHRFVHRAFIEDFGMGAKEAPGPLGSCRRRLNC